MKSSRVGLVVVALAISAAPAAAEDIELELGGRVFVRDTLRRQNRRNDLDIESARLVANYKLEKTLKTQVEVELADGDVELKDAYVRYQPIDELRFKVGRFKRPISRLSMEGAWNLPMVERGLLNDRVVLNSIDAEGVCCLILVVPLPFGARADGVTIEYRPDLPLKPRITVGVFNSRLINSDVDDIRTDSDGVPLVVFESPGASQFEDVFGRLTAEVVEDLHVGATVAAYQRVRNTGGDVNHAGLGSVDVFYKHKYGRAWLEMFYGRTPIVDPFVGRVRGAMWAGRFVVAPRIDHMFEIPVDRLEPFVSVAVLEPSTLVRGFRALQAGGGVSVNVIAQLKAQIEYVHVRSQAPFPIARLDQLFFQVGSKF